MPRRLLILCALALGCHGADNATVGATTAESPGAGGSSDGADPTTEAAAGSDGGDAAVSESDSSGADDVGSADMDTAPSTPPPMSLDAADSGGFVWLSGTDAADATSPLDHCDHLSWRVAASVTTGDGGGPRAAVDGDLTTRWASNRLQDGTDWFSVDFGAPVTLSGIILDNSGTYPSDYPGAYAIYASSDGVSYEGGPFVTGSGTQTRTVINFPARRLQAIWISQVGTSRASNWWQIGELLATCAP
jgi:hypothetical protein